MDISNEQLQMYMFHYENYYSLRTHCSQFMHSLGYSLILCPYTLDSMNSYKIIFNVIGIALPKIVVFWN